MRWFLPLLLFSAFALWLLPGPLSADYCCGGAACSNPLPPGVFRCGDPNWACDSVSRCSAYPASPFCAGNTGINTALGCVPFGGKSTISFTLTWAVRLGGFIAFLVLIYAAFLLITAGGDPKKVAAGRELVTASVAGLVFLALSVVILNFLGVDILGLGNLGFSV